MNRTSIMIGCLLAYTVAMQGESEACDVVDLKAPIVHRTEVSVVPIHLLMPGSENIPVAECKGTTVPSSHDESPVNDEVSEASHQTDNLAELLNLVEDVDIPTPELIKPSFLFVALCSYGIPVAYKFYDIKDWIVEKVF
ncbi:hypothetical protein H0W26_03810 [Candidatus Dependentiae bacterium]|nr:hypothetical protein [Candidatus Dependentiae bacterium]